MPLIVTHGTVCECSCGTAPCSLIVTPEKKISIENLPVATIMDHKSPKNLPTFVMCTIAANPAVAANMNAPAPCVPVLPSPWTPGDPQVTLHGEIILQETSTLTCVYGGVITITKTSQSISECQ
ncbi:DUF4280 domain-containing protein (plasmid) [Deltaproteobacteria bacterium Smac51]|nr:DUF4280 domain-containing protein [Deltaproteobacteria bacterium Smac51]